MGSHPNITAERLPAQGDVRGKRVEVVFHNLPPRLGGLCLRHDSEAPFVTVIQLDDGRVVLGHECRYRPAVGGPMIDQMEGHRV